MRSRSPEPIPPNENAASDLEAWWRSVWAGEVSNLGSDRYEAGRTTGKRGTPSANGPGGGGVDSGFVNFFKSIYV